jgi:hypothetical protein
MSLNISSLFPKVNLTQIANDVGEVTSTLESIAGPKASWTKFASQFEQSLKSNPLLQPTIGPLANPIHSLAQSLLSGVGGFFQGLGNNLV